MNFVLLEKPLKRVEEAYARSFVPRFLSWWKNELLGCLPLAWRNRLSAAPLRVIAERDGDNLKLVRQRGQQRLQELVLSDPETELGLVARFLNHEEEPASQVWLKLPASRVLRRKLSLPLAAAENLPQILAFEMDRQTPFKADQVYFDHRIVRRDPTTGQLSVEIAVVPRNVLDAELALAQRYKLSFDGADCEAQKQPGELAGFNLLPSQLKVERSDRQQRINWILAAGAVALLFALMSQHLQARRAAVETLRAEVDEAQNEAAAVRQIEARLKDAISGANFLADRKCAAPQVINVLLELTERIPDDTWLERISFVSRQVQIQGQSAEANKLIGLLQKAKTVANPQVQGVIQPDPGTGKDRFTIQLDLREGAACPAEEPVA